MAEQTGNWLTGYSGRSDYNPTAYAVKSDAFYRNKGNSRTDQMDQGEQNWMLQKMRDQAFGDQPAGPSVAEQQLKQGMQQRQSAAMSLLGGAGMNPALARRSALMAQESAMGDFNQQAGLLRAQEEAQRRGEQMQAQGMYGQLLGGVRGQNQQMSEADRQALMQLEQMRTGQSMGLNQMRVNQDVSNAQGMNQGGMLAPILSGLSTFGGMALGGYLGR